MRVPAVSVVIPTYNRAALVVRAVQNVLDQIQPDDEVIVVDDASTDNTSETLAPYRDRIRYLPIAHAGAGVARNHGVRAASRPLIAFLDSDDEWFPGKLQLQRSLLAARPDVLFTFSNFSGRNSETIEPHYLRHWHHDDRAWDEILAPGVPFSALASLPAGWQDMKVHIGSMYFPELLSDYIATSTLVVRRVEAGPALRFAEDLSISEDKEAFAQMARVGPGAYLDCDTSYQWEHLGPRLTTQSNSLERARVLLLILDRVWGSDPAFLAEQGEAFEQKKHQVLLLEAQCLLVQGRTSEARSVQRRMSRPIPWSHRLLAALPGPLVQALLALRRLVVRRVAASS